MSGNIVQIAGVLRNSLTLVAEAGIMPIMSFTADGQLVTIMTAVTPAGAATTLRTMTTAATAIADFVGLQAGAVVFASDGTNINPIQSNTRADIAEVNFRGLQVMAVQYASEGTNFIHVPLNASTPTNNADVSCLVTTTTLLAARNRRTSFMLQNNGAYDVWINFGAAAAVVGTRFKIPAGGTFSMEGLSCPSTAIQGIANGGTSQVYVYESGVEAH